MFLGSLGCWPSVERGNRIKKQVASSITIIYFALLVSLSSGVDSIVCGLMRKPSGRRYQDDLHLVTSTAALQAAHIEKAGVRLPVERDEGW